MSGLCGVVSFAGRPAAPQILDRMARASAFRGREGIRLRLIGSLGLARLGSTATPEAVGEEQPSSNLDGTVHLVADLRLDNRSELLAVFAGAFDLSAAPPADAALLLAAYERWGIRCVEYLQGDFAFAIWDQRQHRLLCARDRLGLRPFHFASVGPLFVFASDAQQILHHDEIGKDFDETSVGRHLTGRAPLLDRTFFREISQLRPGHRLIATASGLRIERYWDIDPERRTIYRTGGDYSDHFREMLQRSIDNRLRATGTTVGVSLSGGLDSSAVASLASRSRALGDRRLEGGTFVFDRLTECDERASVKAIAEQTGITVTFITAEPLWLLGDAAAFSPRLETPFLGWESCYRALYGEFRQRGARVLLTGHGADDLLTGSGLAYGDLLRRGDLRAIIGAWQRARHDGRQTSRTLYRWLVRPLLYGRGDLLLRRITGATERPVLPPWLHPDFARRMRWEEAEPQSAIRRFPEALRRLLYDNMIGSASWLRTVHWHDRLGLDEGMETRHPFLDPRLVEYVLSVPPRQFIGPDAPKALLRRALEGSLPEAVRTRRIKTRLGRFMDYSLREKAAERIEEILRSPVSERLGILAAQPLRDAFRAYCTGEPDSSYRRLWPALTLELWLRRYLEWSSSETSGRSVA